MGIPRPQSDSDSNTSDYMPQRQDVENLMWDTSSGHHRRGEGFEGSEGSIDLKFDSGQGSILNRRQAITETKYYQTRWRIIRMFCSPGPSIQLWCTFGKGW